MLRWLRRAGVLTLVLCSWSCAKDPITQLIVRVEADVAIQSMIDEVEITVDGPLRTRAIRQPLGGSQDLELPLILTLLPRSHVLGPFSITVAAMQDAEVMVSQTQVVSMRRDETLEITFALSASCLMEVCSAGETCLDGECVSVTELPPPVAPDGGMGGPTSELSGLDANKQVSMLDEEENRQLCLATLSVYQEVYGGSIDEGSFCMAYGVLLGSSPQMCETYVSLCETMGLTPDDSMSPFDESQCDDVDTQTACMATVGELEACLLALSEHELSPFGSLPAGVTCADAADYNAQDVDQPTDPPEAPSACDSPRLEGCNII